VEIIILTWYNKLMSFLTSQDENKKLLKIKPSEKLRFFDFIKDRGEEVL